MAGSGRRIALTSQGSRLGSQGHAAVFPAGRRRGRQRHPATAFLRPFGPGRVWGRTQGSVRSTLGYDPVLTGDMVNNFPTETLRGNNVFMPWKETHAMDQRMQFILDWKAARESKTELCRRYGIQRRIGYKWGTCHTGFQYTPVDSIEHRRLDAALAQPSAEPQQLARGGSILPQFKPRPRWPRAFSESALNTRCGARRKSAVLGREKPHKHPPAESTIGEILRLEGSPGHRRNAAGLDSLVRTNTGGCSLLGWAGFPRWRPRRFEFNANGYSRVWRGHRCIDFPRCR